MAQQQGRRSPLHLGLNSHAVLAAWRLQQGKALSNMLLLQGEATEMMTPCENSPTGTPPFKPPAVHCSAAGASGKSTLTCLLLYTGQRCGFGTFQSNIRAVSSLRIQGIDKL